MEDNEDCKTSIPTQGNELRGLSFKEAKQQLLNDIEDPVTRHLSLFDICNLRPKVYGSRNSNFAELPKITTHIFIASKTKILESIGRFVLP